MSDLELRIIEEARKRGLDAGRLSPAQYSSLRNAVLIRERGRLGMVPLARDAGASRVRTALGVTIPETRLAIVKRICSACPGGFYKVANDGTPRCGACGCQGKNFDSKQKDPVWFCPEGYWDNTTSEPDFLAKTGELIQLRVLPETVLAE